MPRFLRGRVEREADSTSASVSAADTPSERGKIMSRIRAAVRSKAVCVARWVEDHAEVVILVPVIVLFGAVVAALLWQPATAAGVIIFLAALVAVTEAAFGSANRALCYLRDRRDRHRQALPSSGGEQHLELPAPDDRDDRRDSPKDSSSGEPA